MVPPTSATADGSGGPVSHPRPGPARFLGEAVEVRVNRLRESLRIGVGLLEGIILLPSNVRGCGANRASPDGEALVHGVNPYAYSPKWSLWDPTPIVFYHPLPTLGGSDDRTSPFGSVTSTHSNRQGGLSPDHSPQAGIMDFSSSRRHRSVPESVAERLAPRRKLQQRPLTAKRPAKPGGATPGTGAHPAGRASVWEDAGRGGRTGTSSPRGNEERPPSGP